MIPEDQFDDSGFDFIDNNDNKNKPKTDIGNILGIDEESNENDDDDLMALENDLIVAGA